MSEGGICHRVRTFIAHNIDTAELLDTLALVQSAPERLASAYGTNRVAVVNLVYQRQRDPLRDFSDAFRWRRD